MTEREPERTLQTLDEIRSQHPDEWILIVVSIDNSYPLKGYTISHSRNVNEVVDIAIRIVEFEDTSKTWISHASTQMVFITSRENRENLLESLSTLSDEPDSLDLAEISAIDDELENQ